MLQVFALLASIRAASSLKTGTNPLGKVFELLKAEADKISADGEVAAKAYQEYFEWCDDVSKNTQNEIKSATALREKLESKIAKFASDIEVSGSKIEDLAAAISKDEKELKRATEVRGKEASDFAASEAELMDAVDTLGRAVGILEREMSKNSAAFTQIDTNNMAMLMQTLNTVMDAASFAAVDKQKLVALVQTQDNSDDDDDESGAPAAATSKSQSGGIVDVLADMKDKAGGELAELRKAESKSAHSFKMLQQSIEDQTGADAKDLDAEKTGREEAMEGKAINEGDLAVTTKDLAGAQEELAKVKSGCMITAADHEATIAAREEELKVIAEATKTLKETTSGAAGQTYSLLQVSTTARSHMELKRKQIVTAIKRIAKQEHSSALAQLASRIGVVMQYSSANNGDVFGKVKGLVVDMITKLEREAEDEATEKAYCDEEMAKTEAKKSDLDDALSKLTTKIDQAAAKSVALKGEVKESQGELAALAKEQAELDQIRSEQHADYVAAKKTLEDGLSGVQAALETLREYYGNGDASLVQDDAQSFTAFMQQPAAPQKHEKSTGAGQSIIGMLEVIESDFSKNLAKEETQESDSQSQYDQTTQANKVGKATKEQDIKYQTQEFKGLDKEITELTSDKDTASDEHAAVMEYYTKIKERCVAKPESYEERTKRRTAEISGLKEALSILDEETAFVQHKRHGIIRGAH